MLGIWIFMIERFEGCWSFRGMGSTSVLVSVLVAFCIDGVSDGILFARDELLMRA